MTSLHGFLSHRQAKILPDGAWAALKVEIPDGVSSRTSTPEMLRPTMQIWVHGPFPSQDCKTRRRPSLDSWKRQVPTPASHPSHPRRHSRFLFLHLPLSTMHLPLPGRETTIRVLHVPDSRIVIQADDNLSTRPLRIPETAPPPGCYLGSGMAAKTKARTARDAMRCGARCHQSSPKLGLVPESDDQVGKKAISLLFLSFDPPPVSFVGDATPGSGSCPPLCPPGIRDLVPPLLTTLNQPRQRRPVLGPTRQEPGRAATPRLASHTAPRPFLGLSHPPRCRFSWSQTNSNRLLAGPLPLGLPV